MAGLYKRANGAWAKVGLGPIPDTTPPTAPTNLRTTAKTNTTLTLAWDAATDDRGVVGYQVEVNTGVWLSIGAVLSWQFTGLSAGTSYTFRVRGLDAAGNPGDPAARVDATTGTAPSTQIVFGACPGPSGGVTGIDTKYGTKAKSVRIFQGSAFTNSGLPTDRPAHVSAKIPIASILNGSARSALEAFIASQTQPRLLTWWHEPENDLSQFSLANYQSATETFAQWVNAAPKSVLVQPCVVLMAWTFDSRSGRNPDDWITPSVKVLGVDFDGDDNPTSTTYPMFTPAQQKIPAYLVKHNVTLTIPEFAAPLATGDPSGNLRAAWLNQFATQIFPALGARHVHLFDYPGIYGAREPLQTPAEIAAWASLMAGSPANTF